MCHFVDNQNVRSQMNAEISNFNLIVNFSVYLRHIGTKWESSCRFILRKMFTRIVKNMEVR